MTLIDPYRLNNFSEDTIDDSEDVYMYEPIFQRHYVKQLGLDSWISVIAGTLIEINR